MDLPPSARGIATLVPSPTRTSQQRHPYTKGRSSLSEGTTRSKRSYPQLAYFH